MSPYEYLLWITNTRVGHSYKFQGKVKQIVGSTLRDTKEGDSSLITNYESDLSASEYAQMYKDDGLTGGHVIMLGADPLSEAAAFEALHAYPGRSDLLPPFETFWCIFVMIPWVELI